jgi:hypothetical protein
MRETMLNFVDVYYGKEKDAHSMYAAAEPLSQNVTTLSAYQLIGMEIRQRHSSSLTSSNKTKSIIKNHVRIRPPRL